MNKKKGKSYYLVDVLMSRLFFLVIVVVAIIAMLPFLRPDYSETEKRKLADFPKFSFDVLASGKYFDDINLWYADTFPKRDELMNLNGMFKGSFGVDNSVQIHGDVGISDVIPEDDNTSEDAAVSEVVSSEESSTIVNSSIEETKSELISSAVSSVQSSSSNPSSSKPSSSAVTSSKPKPKPVPAVETLGAVLRVKNAAYEYYNFNEKVAKAYAAYIGYAGEALKGKAKVYDIIAPTSMGITLPADVAKDVNSSNQKDAINYMYKRIKRLSDNAVTVNAYDALYAHKEEYIYFRTDHHWTALGAYYAYCEFIKAKGGTVPTLDMFTERKFNGYLGSFYTQTKSPQLAKTPDTVVAYEPPWTNIIKTTMAKNSIMDKKIVSDGNALSQSNKYLCFISGDRPYGIINNPNIKDGSSCLIIKESYGNAMVPFFLANYQTIHVVDYRHISTVDSRKLLKFVTDNKIQDVVFVNNISATRNKSLVSQIGTYVEYKAP